MRTPPSWPSKQLAIMVTQTDWLQLPWLDLAGLRGHGKLPSKCPQGILEVRPWTITATATTLRGASWRLAVHPGSRVAASLGLTPLRAGAGPGAPEAGRWASGPFLPLDWLGGRLG